MTKKYHLQYTAKDGSKVDTVVNGDSAVTIADQNLSKTSDRRVNCWPVTPSREGS